MTKITITTIKTNINNNFFQDRLLNYLATELLRNKYKFYTQNDIENTIHGLISLQNVAYDNEGNYTFRF